LCDIILLSIQDTTKNITDDVKDSYKELGWVFSKLPENHITIVVRRLHEINNDNGVTVPTKGVSTLLWWWGSHDSVIWRAMLAVV
jgi:hypothetical protein